MPMVYPEHYACEYCQGVVAHHPGCPGEPYFDDDDYDEDDDFEGDLMDMEFERARDRSYD